MIRISKINYSNKNHLLSKPEFIIYNGAIPFQWFSIKFTFPIQDTYFSAIKVPKKLNYYSGGYLMSTESEQEKQTWRERDMPWGLEKQD